MEMSNKKPSPPLSRFSGFTDSKILRQLEHETDHLLLYGLLVAVVIHGMIASFWTSYQPEVRAVQPMPVELRITPPRMTKPFHISRSHKSRQRQKRIVPRGHSILPDADYTSPDSYIMGDYYPVAEDTLLTDYNGDIEPFETDVEEYTPELPHFSDSIERYSGKITSLKEKLLTVDDLEHSMSDLYKGLLLINPNDPNALTGYLYIPSLYVFDTSTAGLKNISPGIIRLADAVCSTTGIRTKIDHQIILGSNSILRAPFLYIGIGTYWEFLPGEPQLVADYVYSGGFVMFENLKPWLKISPSEASLRQFINDAFGSKARLEIIPNDHPIYHNLFQFEGGPPLGAEISNNPDDGNQRKRPVPYLEGIFIDGRLAAIYTNKGYSLIWGDFSPSSKMGINIVLYAMSQLGRKTLRKTDYSLAPNINMIRSSFEPIHKEGNLVPKQY